MVPVHAPAVNGNFFRPISPYSHQIRKARKRDGASRQKKDKSHSPRTKCSRERQAGAGTTARRSSTAAAQPADRQNAKTKALQQSALQGSQFTKQQQKARSDQRRRPSLFLTACTPGWRFRRSRSFPYRPSARPRLPSFAPSRLHSPCRHTSYGRRRWSPYRARSRYRPRTAR